MNAELEMRNAELNSFSFRIPHSSFRIHREVLMSLPIPLPHCPITIRPGTLADVPFMDSLQKVHSKQVGWMPRKQLEEKVRLGHVLVAEEMQNAECRMQNEECGVRNDLAPVPSPLTPIPVGYCIASDQYFKRDDVGIIYQMNVVPGRQRGLIGASLLKAQFERSAYGCKLYCCWCAQDIAANYFWEAMGFVPLAFRTGGMGKAVRNAERGVQSEFTPHSALRTPHSARVHIFWQKRIGAGDDTTPWWFPSKTNGGSIREDRIVLPIPPGVRWNEEMPILLPNADCPLPIEQKRIGSSNRKSEFGNRKSAKRLRRNGLCFDIPAQGEALAETKPAKSASRKAEKVKRACDPRLVAAARELRDRWLEQVNSGEHPQEASGKYDVSRTLGSVEGGRQIERRPAGRVSAVASRPLLAA